MTALETATAKVAAQSTKELCAMFELLQNVTPEVAMARGWIMDELEKRNPEAFEMWIDCEDVALMEKPAHFFC